MLSIQSLPVGSHIRFSVAGFDNYNTVGPDGSNSDVDLTSAQINNTYTGVITAVGCPEDGECYIGFDTALSPAVTALVVGFDFPVEIA